MGCYKIFCAVLQENRRDICLHQFRKAIWPMGENIRCYLFFINAVRKNGDYFFWNGIKLTSPHRFFYAKYYDRNGTLYNYLYSIGRNGSGDLDRSSTGSDQN